jgi:hypothetical protein
MSVLEQIVLAWQCLLYTLRQALRPALWVPWGIVAAVQLAVIACLWWFAHPALSWFMAPLLERAGGEWVLHYPGIFQAMPALFARADILLGVTLGSLAAGASTALFATRFAGRPAGARAGLKAALRRAGALIVVNLPLAILVVGLSLGLHALTAGHGGLTARLGRLAGIGGAIALQALFLYVNALVIVGGRSALGALAEIPAVAGKALPAALVLAAGGAVALLPFQMLTGSAHAIVARGRPELAGWALVAQVAATLLVGFALTGSGTLVYQSLVARDEDA